VWIEMAHLGPDSVRRAFKGMVERCADCGFDLAGDRVEVVPTAHYMMGGVEFAADCTTALPGLFVAGEDSGGVHGANRLGGNSLSDLLVFGKRAGEFAARFAKENTMGAVDPDQVEETARRALEPFECAQGADGAGPFQIQRELQDMMQDLVGIVRREDELQRALEAVGRLQKRARAVGVTGHREFNPGWHTALDLCHLLTVSEAITRSALERKESRGGHFRDDYPDKDAALGTVNVVLKKALDGSMQVRREPIPPLPDYLKRVLEENK
jgi:succinate dehydrogenase / fumarate reductase flavoprotein subunit